MNATLTALADPLVPLEGACAVTPPFHTFQAEAFVARFRRCGASADLDAEFRRWAGTKDFSSRDLELINGEVRRLLAQEEVR